MKKSSFGYKALLRSADLNQRFGDLFGGSILNGFRLHKGTSQFAVSVRRDNDDPSVLLTPEGIRLEETEDVIDAFTLRPNMAVGDRFDVIYANYAEKGENATFRYEVMEGVPGQPVDVLKTSNIRMALGYVKVKKNVALDEADFVSLQMGMRTKTLIYERFLTLPEGLNAKFLQLEGKPVATEALVNEKAEELKGILASKTTVDALAASLGSGGPKGVYATLAELQAAKPSGDTNTYVVTADGKWYFWNTSAWVAGGIYQATLIADNGIDATKIADASISPSKTNFLEALTLNLVDASKLQAGYVDSANGTIVNSASFQTTDFIEVLAGESYSTNAGGASGGYYNANKQFVQAIAYNASKPYVIPAGVKYMRVPFSTSQIATARAFKGTQLLDYVPYVSDVKIKPTVKVPAENITGKIAVTVAPDDTTFLTKTKNIFDKKKIKVGFSISATTGALNTQSDQNFCVVEFMPCKSNTLYQKTGNYHVAFYDANKVFISGVASGAGARSWTTPANAVYVSITIYLTQDNPDIYMVYEGSSMPSKYVPPYESLYSTGERTPLTTVEFVSYGDSLTQMNVWQDVVASKLGLKSTVRGIGGTTIAENGSIAWVDANGTYLARPPETQPAGSTQILSSLVNDQRIATIPTTAKVITLFGGTNDLYTHVPIGGTIDFNDPTKFKSAYAITIKKILLRCPRARLFTVTPPQNNKFTSANNAGHTTKDYADAIKEVSRLYGIPCIDLFGECGFNEYNLSQYLSDGVHPLDTGAIRMQEVIYRNMVGIV